MCVDLEGVLSINERGLLNVLRDAKKFGRSLHAFLTRIYHHSLKLLYILNFTNVIVGHDWLVVNSFVLIGKLRRILNEGHIAID